jgi:hypothetical protein
MEKPDQSGNIPWIMFRGRNLALLKNLTDTYGACAVVARVGDIFVGHLRFYPKAVCELSKQGLGMCLQQEFPYGPAEDLGSRKFPPQKALKDKTLVVHCMMLASSGPGGETCRRKGVGTQMAQALIDWATINKWHAIVSTAYETLPIVYALTGQAGRNFWEKLGFRLIRIDQEPALEEETEFVRKMREEARAHGLNPAAINNKYIMRLDIR